jgi:inosine triphosphate pyrophosphatase
VSRVFFFFVFFLLIFLHSFSFSDLFLPSFLHLRNNTITTNSYVKDFLKAIGPEGLPKLLAGFEDERAYAQCVFAFAKVENVKKAEKEGEETPSTSAAARVFVGRTHGSIARTPRGPRTFGWDCIFVPGDRDGEEGKEVEKNNNPGQLTYAEMPASRKNLISHRRRALDKLRAFLVERYSE